jgi:AcrR family transcriptional regulator
VATAERILDAAGTLFAERGVDAVEMKDIARAAGCSRATLYRYFDSRASLRTAYVHREARNVRRRLTEIIAGIADPSERLLAGMMQALRLVRESPSLSAWFAGTSAGSREAAESEVVAAMTAAFLQSAGIADSLDRRARWLVRALTSLLIAPGRDDADERAMLTEFVIPVIAPVSDAVSG